MPVGWVVHSAFQPRLLYPSDLILRLPYPTCRSIPPWASCDVKLVNLANSMLPTTSLILTPNLVHTSYSPTESGDSHVQHLQTPGFIFLKHSLLFWNAFADRLFSPNYSFSKCSNETVWNTISFVCTENCHNGRNTHKKTQLLLGFCCCCCCL